MSNQNDNNYKKLAQISGYMYLLLIPFGFYAIAYVLPQIVVIDDISATMENISNSETLFRMAIVSILLMNIISIFLVVYLYKLLKSINSTTALFMFVLMLFGAGISMLNEINHFALIFLNNNDQLVNFTNGQAQTLISLFLDMQEHGTYVAVIFWGLWLFPLGMLIFKLDTSISKLIGIMLLIAGVGYVLDSIGIFLMPDFWSIALSDYTFIGELLLTLWLLFRSGDIEKLIVQYKG